jgi:3-deoxy-manno-octulosonate cytidylyltransferase (CMP-KDO synthetase)
MNTVGIIPARYGSTRFPGKPLAKILGVSMIQRVYEQCIKSKKLTSLIVATDEKKIYNHVLKFGGKAMMTSENHRTGTERCEEVAQSLSKDVDIIVNIQGDEPYINPLQIDEIIKLFINPNTQIGTLAQKIDDKEIFENENNPKVIFDLERNALNFCRKITSNNSVSKYYKHIGIYAFKKKILHKICKLPQSRNEIREKLEQLRWLDNDFSIRVGITNFQTISVDTPSDIKKIEAQII